MSAEEQESLKRFIHGELKNFENKDGWLKRNWWQLVCLGVLLGGMIASHATLRNDLDYHLDPVKTPYHEGMRNTAVKFTEIKSDLTHIKSSLDELKKDVRELERK